MLVSPSLILLWNIWIAFPKHRTFLSWQGKLKRLNIYTKLYCEDWFCESLEFFCTSISILNFWAYFLLKKIFQHCFNFILKFQVYIHSPAWYTLISSVSILFPAQPHQYSLLPAGQGPLLRSTREPIICWIN